MRAVISWNSDGIAVIELHPETDQEADTIMRQCLNMGMNDDTDCLDLVGSTYQETEGEIFAVASGHDGKVLQDTNDNFAALEIRLFKGGEVI